MCTAFCNHRLWLSSRLFEGRTLLCYPLPCSMVVAGPQPNKLTDPPHLLPGHYVPELAYEIVTHNDTKPAINLQGFLVGTAHLFLAWQLCES